jgi:membrane-bound serine protease (ClpP class)
VILVASFFWLFFCTLGAASSFAQNKIVILQVSGSINPGVADYIAGGIEKAEELEAVAVVIELDTPGGLVDSMRKIVMAQLACGLPVVVFVSPGGARAASAGVFITLAADIAAMAPGTNIGAAHPVGSGGQNIDGPMSEKIVNDMVAFGKSIAKKQGRNMEWIEKAIRESDAITEAEALKMGIIDLTADSMDDLVKKINKRKVPGKGILDLDKVEIIYLDEGIKIKILKTIADPNIAYILLMIGLAGLYFELSTPGAVFPGVIGGICLVLAFYSFQTLPVNYAGILLICLAVIFLILEIKIASYGLLTLAGIISLVLGSLMLFEEGLPYGLEISWKVLAPTIFLVCGFFIAVTVLVVKAQKAKPLTGISGMIGEIAVAKTDLNPGGKVIVHGELWNALSHRPVSAGQRVRVLKVDNLTLLVEPTEGPEKIGLI